MKRDMDLVRKILLLCEECGEEEHLPGVPTIEGYSSMQVSYHVHLMWQAGLVEAVDLTNLGDTCPQAQLRSVTWEGHDFAESIRSTSIWSASKEVARKVGGVGIEIMIEIVKAQAKEQLKRLGINLGA